MPPINLAALDQKFACLDALPALLYETVVTHPHGELLIRVEGVLQWRSALLAGHLPKHQDLLWPAPSIGLAVLKRLEALDICRYCQQQEELTDRVLLDLLEGIQSAEDYFRLKPDGFVDKLAQRQNRRDRESPFEDPGGLADHVPPEQEADTPQAAPNDHQGKGEDEPRITGDDQPQPAPAKRKTLDDCGVSAMQDAAAQVSDLGNLTDQDDYKLESTDDITTPSLSAISDENDTVATYVADLLTARWQQLLDQWKELSVEFAELAGLLGRGWDLSQGTLQSAGWRQIIRYRKLLKRAPALQRLVAQLGRRQPTSGKLSVSNSNSQTAEPSPPLPTQAHRERPIPSIKMETGGIERSDDINRMLPGELALLGHPVLKKLWYARRAERQLMTYRYHGKNPKTHQVLDGPDAQAPLRTAQSEPGQGPILVCLDTSGSMHGQPEHIAKALVLEALRIAYSEQRACHVFSFSGPDQVIEHELDLTQGGLIGLLSFLQQSFYGGTDVTTPLQRALEKQRHEGWQRADILLISDGRFPLHSEWITRIKHLKQKQGLRVHGLLLGNWKADALQSICSPCHRFNDWRCLDESL